LIWTVIKTDNPKTAKTAKIRKNPQKSEKNENKPKKPQPAIPLAVKLNTTFNTYDICGTFWILHPWNISWKMEGDNRGIDLLGLI